MTTILGILLVGGFVLVAYFGTRAVIILTLRTVGRRQKEVALEVEAIERDGWQRAAERVRQRRYGN